ADFIAASDVVGAEAEKPNRRQRDDGRTAEQRQKKKGYDSENAAGEDDQSNGDIIYGLVSERPKRTVYPRLQFAQEPRSVHEQQSREIAGNRISGWVSPGTIVVQVRIFHEAGKIANGGQQQRRNNDGVKPSEARCCVIDGSSLLGFQDVRDDETR